MVEVQELVRRIHSSPGPHDAQALAEEFSLDPKVVEIAIRQARQAPAPAIQADREGWPQRSLRLAGRLFERALAHPLKYLAVSAAVSLLPLFVASHVLAGPAREARLPWFMAGALVAVPVLHGIALRVWGSWRLALWSATLTGAFWAACVAPDAVRNPQVVLLLGLTTGVLQLFLGMAAALLGAYAKVRRAEAHAKAMTRQEMLVRLVDVRERLASHSDSQSGRSPSWLEPRGARWVAFAVLAPICLRLAASPLMWAVDPGQQVESGLLASPAVATAAICFAALDAGAMVCSGFLAGRLQVAGVAGALYFASSVLAGIVPGVYFRTRLSAGIDWAAQGAALAIAVAFATVGGVVQRLAEAARKAQMLRENDREALLAEMIDLEWRLQPERRRAVVLVVDVAGSTAMKQGVDPLVAEMCFREYQAMVERVCEAYGGKVHSRAGDGAVVGFADERSALAAARALHDQVAGFNRERNRLPEPFRLRVGLHAGEVMGELSEVEFSRVIDEAAHVEAAAPVGGIAVSSEVAAALPGRAFEPVPSRVEGLSVLVLAPEPSETRNGDDAS